MQTLLPYRRNNITYSEFVSVASVIQNAKRMRNIMSFVAFVQNLSTFSHIRCHFCTELLNTKCAFDPTRLPETFIIFKGLNEILSEMYRVSIKSFPDYKHLLQENYVE